LDYFGKRFYDPDIARWISPDPDEQFFDLYAYAGNGFNPISSIDKDGRGLVGAGIAASLASAGTYNRLKGKVSQSDLMIATSFAGIFAGAIASIDVSDAFVGAFLGSIAAMSIEAVCQYYEGGKNFNSINWGSVGMNGLLAGVSAGVLQKLFSGLFGSVRTIAGTDKAIQSGGILNLSTKTFIRDFTSAGGGVLLDQSLNKLFKMFTSEREKKKEKKPDRDNPTEPQEQQQQVPEPDPPPAPAPKPTPPPVAGY